jgi:hypothetical protein
MLCTLQGSIATAPEQQQQQQQQQLQGEAEDSDLPIISSQQQEDGDRSDAMPPSPHHLAPPPSSKQAKHAALANTPTPTPSSAAALLALPVLPEGVSLSTRPPQTPDASRGDRPQQQPPSTPSPRQQSPLPTLQLPQATAGVVAGVKRVSFSTAPPAVLGMDKRSTFEEANGLLSASEQDADSAAVVQQVQEEWDGVELGQSVRGGRAAASELQTQVPKPKMGCMLSRCCWDW